jgi:NAD(P)-dependent dehydrogenase (short-subunit alcohol dehydrogenase family)
MRIEGSSALVVGGASGLGEATARRLHDLGAPVTVADVNAERGQALADELGGAFAHCDVRDEDQVRAAVDLAAGREGGLRIGVVCAGTGWAQRIAGSKGPTRSCRSRRSSPSTSSARSTPGGWPPRA